MSAKKREKPVTARGKSIPRTAAELDQMSSEEFLRNLAPEAAEDWRENARLGANLLDARAIEE